MKYNLEILHFDCLHLTLFGDMQVTLLYNVRVEYEIPDLVSKTYIGEIHCSLDFHAKPYEVSVVMVSLGAYACPMSSLINI